MGRNEQIIILLGGMMIGDIMFANNPKKRMVKLFFADLLPMFP